MAGHSQFSNIMHRKGAQDKKRAKIFSKLIREITVAAKSGLPDPAMNPRLRAAISAAKAANMPKDNVERAVKKAVGGDDDTEYSEIRYEGYGPSGVAIIVEVLTDNRNRAAAEVRSTFTKFGGSLGETNSVSFMFNRVAEVGYRADIASDDEMFEAALEAGAENVESDAESHTVTAAVEDFSAVRDALEARFGSPASAGLVWRPLNTVANWMRTRATTLLKLLDALDDNDDVQRVAANFEISRRLTEVHVSGRGAGPLARLIGWPGGGAGRHRLGSWEIPGRSYAREGVRMRVLGLDPGLRHTGWGVIDVSGNRLTHVADGTVNSSPKAPTA